MLKTEFDKPFFFYSNKPKKNIKEILRGGRSSNSSQESEGDTFGFFEESIPNDFLSALFPFSSTVYEMRFFIDSRFSIREKEMDIYYQMASFYVSDLLAIGISQPSIRLRRLLNEVQ